MYVSILFLSLLLPLPPGIASPLAFQRRPHRTRSWRRFPPPPHPSLSPARLPAVSSPGGHQQRCRLAPWFAEICLSEKQLVWKAINVCVLRPTSGWLGENWGGLTAGLRDALLFVSMAGTYRDTGVPRCHLPPLNSINEINAASHALNCHVSLCVRRSLFVEVLTNCFVQLLVRVFQV